MKDKEKQIKFSVIDNQTGEYPDLYKIALKEEWAKGLMYCDMEGFSINEDGQLVLSDECGKFVYCPSDRFTVVFEDSVVITREEYEMLQEKVVDLRHDKFDLKNEISEKDNKIALLEETIDCIKFNVDSARKETAEKILQEINNYLKLYSHIHNYAQEARKSTEQYADGEPVEMESVWDVITLNKNGYVNYETMNTLQDNIENIAKSRLLREIEKDFRLFAEKYGVEIE